VRHPLHLLGFDYGASNGRAIHGAFDGERLTIGEVHRFPNDPVAVGGTLHWDILRLYHEMRQGLLKAARAGIRPDSIGIDTWGVDYALLDGAGRMLANPTHYRDPRTDGLMEAAFDTMPQEAIFAETGLAFLPFNTLYQLLAERNAGTLSRARTLLFIPDLLSFFLTGEMGTEYTIASTAQLTHPGTRDWALPVIDAFGLPRGLFTHIHEPGGLRGALRAGLAAELGLPEGVRVAAVGQHDTASAVAAVPAQGGRFAYISSGTWSLLGAETRAPVISPAVMAANYTNEGGVAGTTRVLKNIMGLWILQECRRIWLAEGDCEDYAGLAALAEGEAPFRSLFDPDDARFLPQGDMPTRIRAYCRETAQPIPETRAQVARSIYESLALKYRWALTRLERDILQDAVDCLHIVGGGSQNRLLNQMTANAIARPVLAGPSEATAIGNLLMQALALGAVGSLDELRAVVRASFAPETFLPADAPAWDDAYGRFLAIAGLPL
jgi:sugar (pentulose or hexulose) kinase